MRSDPARTPRSVSASPAPRSPGADRWIPTALSLNVFERIEARKTFVELSNGAYLPLEQPAFRELMGYKVNSLDSVATRAG